MPSAPRKFQVQLRFAQQPLFRTMAKGWATAPLLFRLSPDAERQDFSHDVA